MFKHFGFFNLEMYCLNFFEISLIIELNPKHFIRIP